MKIELVTKHNKKPGEYYIPRFMIDKAYQGKGYGRKFMVLLMDEIKQRPAKIIHIVYSEKNTTAKNLYESLGFRAYGKDECGDILAKVEC